MATTPVEFDLGVAGLTVTASVYPLKNDTAVASGKSCNPQTNRTTTYRFNVTENVTGVNDVRVYESGVEIARFVTESMLDDTTVYKAADYNTSLVAMGGVAQSATDLKAFADDCYSPALNRVKTDMVYTNASVNDASATSSSFVTTITLLPTGALNDLQISFTSGTLIGQTKPIATYTNGTGVITVSEAFTSAPGDTDTFDILRNHVHPVADIQSGLATVTELAKVPKSDGTSTWNSTALASIQSEAADALTVYDPPTNAEMEARTLVAANYFDPATDTVANVTTVGSVTTKTGYKLASDGLDLTQLHLDWLNGGRLDLLIDAILADSTSLNDTVLAEIATATDAPATPTLRQAVMLVYMWLRNNTQDTATLRKILNDAGTTVLQGTMTDSGTVFTQGKLGNP